MAENIERVGCTAGVDIVDYKHTAALVAALIALVALAALVARCRNLVGLFSEIVCVVAFYVQTVHCQDHHGLFRS